MKNSNVISIKDRGRANDPLTELLRKGAGRLIKAAVEAELEEFMLEFKGEKLENGYSAVVRNGYLPERVLQTGIGSVTVKIPKVRSRTGEAVTFQSALVPPYVRKTRSLEAALPWLYLKGISTGEMGEALKVLVGEDALGLSATTVSRLKAVWAEEYRDWCGARLDKDEWVYVWADGIYSGLRGEEADLCALVIIGVNELGQKHFLAIEDGIRESKQSWREVLLKLKERGVNSPKLAVGDGALGFWSALNEIYPETKHQRCWAHKTRNVLNCLPTLSQPKAKQSLHQIWQAETKENAQTSFDLFIRMYEGKYPKATICLQKDHEELLAFFDFPAQHWQSIRTTNPIESTFGTIRHRTKHTKGCLAREGMLSMIFKLGQCAEKKWLKLRGFKHIGKVIKGVKFKNGIEVNSPEEHSNQIAA